MAKPTDFSPTVADFDRGYTRLDYEQAKKRARKSDWREVNKTGEKRSGPWRSLEHWKEIWLHDNVWLDGDNFIWDHGSREGTWNHAEEVLELVDRKSS